MDTTFNKGQYESLGQNTDYFAILAKVPFLYRVQAGELISTDLHSWDEDADLMASTTLGGAIADDSTTACTVTSSALMMAGDILYIDTESVRVTSVTNSTTLVIERGYWGSTAAAHDNGSTVTMIGHTDVQGGDTPDSPSTTVTRQTNNVFEIQTPFEVSDMAMLGNSTTGNLMDYTQSRAYLSHLVKIERMLYFSQAASIGSATAAAYCKGLMGWVSSHSYAITSATIGGTGGNTTLTVKKLNKVLELMSNTGGSGTYEVQCGATAFSAVQQAFSSASIDPLSSLGGTYGNFFMTYVSEQGVCQFIKNTNFITGSMEIIDVGRDPGTSGFQIREHVGSGIGLRAAAQVIELAKTGTATKKAFVSRATLQAKLADKCCGRITGITVGG